jgi:hypothetical protein
MTCNGRVLKHSYPQLFSYAKKENTLIKAILETGGFHSMFHLPLFEEAYKQFCELDFFMQSMELSGDKDSWSYFWGSSAYS